MKPERRRLFLLVGIGWMLVACAWVALEVTHLRRDDIWLGALSAGLAVVCCTVGAWCLSVAWRGSLW